MYKYIYATALVALLISTIVFLVQLQYMLGPEDRATHPAACAWLVCIGVVIILSMFIRKRKAVNDSLDISKLFKTIPRTVRVYRKLKRSLSAFKLAWNNYDWDYYYLLELMRWKLRRMEPEIRHGLAVDGDKRADKIKLCVLLLDRLIEDNYISNRYAKYLEDWFDSRRKCTLENGRIGFEIPRKKGQQKAVMEYERKLTDNRRQQDWDLLFKILHRNLQTFWD